MANMTFKTNLLPNSTTLEYSLGSEDKQWNIYGELNGNASSADKLKTARTLTIGGTGKDFDGSANVSWSLNEIGATVSNTWTAGTTAGPTITTTVNGVAGTPVAIPSASASASGIVTTGVQTFAGTKTMQNNAGALYLSSTVTTRGTVPSSYRYGGVYVIDSTANHNHADGGRLGVLEAFHAPNGQTGIQVVCYPNTLNSTATNYIALYVTQNGTATYSLRDPAAFRTALGLGTHATDSTAYVTVSTAQTISGVKTFSSQPVLNAGFSWPAPANVTCTGNNSEWSFDMMGTNSYWHVWSGTNSASCLQCFNSDRHSWAYKLYGAVWNDYAEYRETKETIEPGRCIYEIGDDTLELTIKRLQAGCEIVSDTFGFAIGQSKKNNTPTATVGRVLAYPYEDREEFRKHIGEPVCSGPNGTVSIMTEEEEMKYPSRIIGTISAVPDYEEWQCGDEKKPEFKKVNGRIWIRVR